MQDFEIYSKACEVAGEICKEFEEEVGSTICSKIQQKLYGRSFNLREKKDYDAFIDAGGHSETGCPKVCEIAAKIAVKKIFRKK
jgi:hypothetical protein